MGHTDSRGEKNDNGCCAMHPSLSLPTLKEDPLPSPNTLLCQVKDKVTTKKHSMTIWFLNLALLTLDHFQLALTLLTKHQSKKRKRRFSQNIPVAEARRNITKYRENSFRALSFLLTPAFPLGKKKQTKNHKQTIPKAFILSIFILHTCCIIKHQEAPLTLQVTCTPW